MTYNVFGGMLSLFQSIMQTVVSPKTWRCVTVMRPSLLQATLCIEQCALSLCCACCCSESKSFMHNNKSEQ